MMCIMAKGVISTEKFKLGCDSVALDTCLLSEVHQFKSHNKQSDFTIGLLGEALKPQCAPRTS